MSELDRDRTEDEGISLDRAADAFRDLGDPTRIAIIEALVTAQRRGDSPLSFAELRRELDVTDSGRFNYHLQQLQPRFVQAVDDGYQARYAGMMAYSLVQARAATGEEFERESQIERPCLICDGSPRARYASDRVTIICQTFDEQLLGMPIPPAVAEDRTLEEIIDFAQAQAGQQMTMALDGICPYCWGSMSFTIEEAAIEDDEESPPGDLISTVQVDLLCNRCRAHFNMPLRAIVSEHPAVAGFHYNRGVDLSEIDLLGLFNALEVVDSGITDDEHPWITFECAGEYLRIETGADLEVVAVSCPTVIEDA